METYGHEIYRKMYDIVVAVLDGVKPMPFQDFINSSIDEVYDVYCKAGSDYYRNSEVCQALQSLHDFGNSLVLLTDDTELDYEITKEMIDLFMEQEKDVTVNVRGKRYCIYLSINPVSLKFGNSDRLYNCLGIKHMSGKIGCTFYIPMDISVNRIFMGGCKVCNNCSENCIHPSSSSISQLNRLYNGILTIHSTDDIKDIHKSICTPTEIFKHDIMLLYTALLRYKDGSNKKVDKHCKVHTPSNNSNKSYSKQCNTYDNESIVYRKSEPSSYKGGHHSSPTVHYVDGYWRKRSKTDDTLIFIKGFARGGTEEERKNFDIKSRKQKVYSV